MIAKCPCEHCGANIEFATEEFLPGSAVTCPMCGKETSIFISLRSEPAPKPAKPESATTAQNPAPKPKKAAKWVWWVIGMVTVTIIATFLLIQTGEYGHDYGAALGMGVIVAVSFAASILLYFAPTFVAHNNKKKNFKAIFVLNFFAGWTFVGWIVALVWAHTAEDKTV